MVDLDEKILAKKLLKELEAKEEDARNYLTSFYFSFAEIMVSRFLLAPIC